MKVTSYEIEVLQLMLKPEIGEFEYNKFIDYFIIDEYNYTGAGYFLNLKYQGFNYTRLVIHEPLIIGKFNNIEVGFVLFLEKDILTIECHSFNEYNPPENIRQLELVITTGE